MDDRRMVSALVAATIAKMAAAAGSSFVPRLTSGTVADAGTRPTVVLDSTSDAVQMNTAGDAPGPGERVWCLQVLGQWTVIGRRGGSQRLLGYATDTTSTDTFTAQEVLGALDIEFTVLQPGRVVMLLGSAQIAVDTNGATVVGEFLYDGAASGRWMRHNFPLAAQAEFSSGHYLLIDPEPGNHTAAMAGTCTGGTGTLVGGTTPAWLTVMDIGPVGGTMP